MLEAGKILELKVLRKTDIGYILVNSSDEELFLHNNDSLHQELVPGSYVSAFLFYDNKARLAGTLKMPFISDDKIDLLEVKAVNYDLGVFLDNNISKDLLLSNKDLPINKTKWPSVGDKLVVGIRSKGRLVAKLCKSSDFKNVVKSHVMDTINGYIQEIKATAYIVVDDSLEIFFLAKDQTDREYHLGEKVTGVVYFISEMICSIKAIKNKENRIEDNATKILEFLKTKKDIILTAKTTSTQIDFYFGISKNDFKIAIGNLYKRRLIYYEEDRIKLT
jgi:predicted RNA-binding protein (virulence factor B family)